MKLFIILVDAFFTSAILYHYPRLKLTTSGMRKRFGQSIQPDSKVQVKQRAETLAKVQGSSVFTEPIKTEARITLQKCYKYMFNDFDTYNLSAHELSLIVNSPLKALTKPGSATDRLINDSGLFTISQLVDSTLSRGKINKIIKIIPLTLQPLLLDEYEYQIPNFIMSINSNLTTMISCKSFQLEYSLRHAFKKVQIYSVAEKYGLENDTEVERITWSNIWKIKNPRVQSVRF